ncbi:MAG: aminotransferase class I/II-fold pyridoxal phosphate-dependent enzyme, partial [Eggerthellaceae bacterium]|nr:aminotransferase class I/II-fold pyridoxal phosphate-dependent enzyme [Eggerthellaceae bacterium]
MATIWQETLELLYKNQTYGDMFHMMDKFGNKIAAELTDKDGKFVTRTYAEYIEMTKSACGNLGRMGFENAGKLIGIYYESNMNWPVLFWGVLMSGNIPLLLNAMSDANTAAGVMREGRAVAYIAEEPIPGDEFRFLAAEDVLAPGEAGKETWSQYVALHTSGTTGNSRLFLYDSKTIAAHIISFDEAKQANPNLPLHDTKPTKILAFLPFHHVFGFSVVYILYSITGQTLVYLKDRAVQTILGACKSHKVTNLYCVPLFFNALAAGINKQVPNIGKKPWFVKKIVQSKVLGTNIRTMITGGGHVPLETLQTINDLGYSLVNGFGMTETGIVCVELSTKAEQCKKGSIGIPFRVSEYRVGNGEEEQGELFLKGDALYTASIIDGQIIPRDREQWFGTGDLVRKDKDGIYIIGRLKDVVVNASGENIYPDELEDNFNELPGVDRICLLGIKHGVYEDLAIVAHPDEDFDTDKFAAAVKAVNAKLPSNNQVVEAYVSSEPLPISGNMKVKRLALKKQIEEDSEIFTALDLYGINKAAAKKKAQLLLDFTLDPEYQVLLSEIREMAAAAFERAIEDTPVDAFFAAEMGVDSLTVISFISSVEEKFEVMILDGGSKNIMCLKDVADFIYATKHGLPIPGATHDEEMVTKRITDFAESEEYHQLKQRMEETFKEGFNPYFIAHDSLIRDTSIVNGKRVINLGSYNYLGMSGHPETERAAIEAILKYGTSASGSRTLAGEKTLYRDLERTIAKWKHTDDAIVGTGGWATNLSFVSTFARKGDLIVYDMLSHNSLTEGVKLSEADSKAFEHNDLAQLEGILKRAEGKYNKVLIIVEG